MFLVEDSYFTDLQRFGVHAKHSIGNNSNDNRHTNFVFEETNLNRLEVHAYFHLGLETV